jgi:DNA-damage-inducible protein D
MEITNKTIVFQEKQVRRVWHNEEWWYVVNDIVQALTNTPDPKRYWKEIKKRDPELMKGGGEISSPLSIETAGGKQKLNCANTKGVFRIIMSVPSPKAEPFKLWLAQVGQERLEEIENPELGIERVKELYKSKGYSDEWIDTRLQSIEVRKQLTDEWQKRKVEEGREYAILTAEIAKGTFGLSPTEHKNFKGLERQNLRDHMTTLELIFTQLGEEMTRKLAVEQNAIGFDPNAKAAKQGGQAAGDARRAAEKRTGVKVVSPDNFLNQIEPTKPIKPTIVEGTQLPFSLLPENSKEE